MNVHNYNFLIEDFQNKILFLENDNFDFGFQMTNFEQNFEQDMIFGDELKKHPINEFIPHKFDEV